MVDFENALSKMTDVLTLLWFTVQKFNGQQEEYHEAEGGWVTLKQPWFWEFIEVLVL